MGTTFIPIPINTSHEPPKCPHCHKSENKKVVCRNCGYEYPEEGSGCFGPIVIIAIVLFCIYLLVTLAMWAFPFPGTNPTLVEVFISQWEWLKGLFHKIY